MRVSRSKLITHLQHIRCGGQIGEVVLRETFEADAITEDHTLLICASGLEQVEPLTEPIGVVDLNLFISSLKAFGEDDQDEVSVTFEDGRIALEEEHRGIVRLITAAPTQISTNIAEENRDKLVEHVSGHDPVPLPQSFVKSVLNTINLLKADSVIVHIGTKGTTFQVGAANADYAELELPNHKVSKVKEMYDLHLDASKVEDVMGQLSDFTQAEIVFTGEESVVGVKDGRYTYILSPMEAEE